MERNSMAAKDVRGDTHYAMEAIQKVMVGRGKSRINITVANVIALKKCGCNGPVIGHVQTVPLKGYPDELPEAPEGTKAKLWAVYPSGRSSGSYKPVAYAWGLESAAHALRNWWAVRNVKAVMKKREEVSK